MTALLLIAALGAGLVGGVFFAFSSFVMAGLARLPAPDGANAMRSINVTAVRPGLMIAVFGTAAACVAVLVLVHGPFAVIGALVYLLGAIGVTAGVNVPLNNALARSRGSDADAETWDRYLARWTAANHVRAASGATACLMFLLALA